MHQSSQIFLGPYIRAPGSVGVDVVEPLIAMTRPAALQKEISVMQSMPMADVGDKPVEAKRAAIRCPHDLSRLEATRRVD